jgi:hypothetical protein
LNQVVMLCATGTESFPAVSYSMSD